jgi:hypothetical protein
MRPLIILCCLLIPSVAYAQNTPEVYSPDGKLELRVSITDGKPVYAVSY